MIPRCLQPRRVLYLWILLGGFLWGLRLPHAEAEQWVDVTRVQAQSETFFQESTQAYCQHQGQKPCDFKIGIALPDTRRFKLLNFLEYEALRMEAMAPMSESLFRLGYGTFTVDVYGIDSTRRQRLVLPVQVKQMVNAWQVLDNIPAGSALAGHVQAVQVAVALREVPQILQSQTLPAHAKARSLLRAGQMLTQGQVQIPPLVSAWQGVKIIVEMQQGSSNPLRLVMDGKALQSGALGDVIKVQQKGFQEKVYQGEVLPNGTVLVKL